MASTSIPKPSSSSSPSTSSSNWKYSVFLSFRGEDTRNIFVGHLYSALDRYGIYTYKDDITLERGKTISPELLQAIEESRFAIVVLSKNFASSTWCLEELAKIMECMDTRGQTVVPIFYNVDPADVRKQTGSFGEAIAMHEQKFRSKKEKEAERDFFSKAFNMYEENGEDKAMVQRWRDALTKVGSIAGWDSRGRDDAILIKDITKSISKQLFSLYPSHAENLVGMDVHIQEMICRLRLDTTDDVCMVGILGMGGLGKTTIARVIYEQISPQFEEGRCFLEDVKESFKKNGPAALQKELLRRIFLDENLSACVLNGGPNVIKQRLRGKKVLIVLDDVDHLEQLEMLASKSDWFGNGSRIIITTRDKHLLVAHGVNDIYEVKPLNDCDALQLFKNYAFKENPPTEEFLELSNHVVSYAKGLPLALKVLGSFLYGRSRGEWQSALKRLECIPDKDIVEKLRISYDGLADDQQNMFLDIACDEEETCRRPRIWKVYSRRQKNTREN